MTRREDTFRSLFGRSAEGTWTAPGRINLIGEHTDYNEGFVLPMALPQGVSAAVARRPDGFVRVASQQTGDRVEIPPADLRPTAVSGWAAYPAGVIWALRDLGHPVGGLDILIDGDLPPGAGLSSSAAIECATALAVTELYDIDLDRLALAHLARRAENEFVGMPCGVMDQAASLLCTAGNGLFLDTRSSETEQVPLALAEHDVALVVIDTQAPRQLMDGEYAERRRACERAAALLGVKALRDIAPSVLDAALGTLPDDRMRRRVRHVVTENDRVLQTVHLLRAGKLADIGPVLTASHDSLRRDYGVTIGQLDLAVEAALSAGALGARMTGGGFGGCVIALVEAQQVDSCARTAHDAFIAEGFPAPAHFLAIPSAGARRTR